MATDGGGHKLVVMQRSTGLQEVSDLNLTAMPLHFTLALPFGTAGWHCDPLSVILCCFFKSLAALTACPLSVIPCISVKSLAGLNA